MDAAAEADAMFADVLNIVVPSVQQKKVAQHRVDVRDMLDGREKNIKRARLYVCR